MKFGRKLSVQGLSYFVFFSSISKWGHLWQCFQNVIHNSLVLNSLVASTMSPKIVNYLFSVPKSFVQKSILTVYVRGNLIHVFILTVFCLWADSWELQTVRRKIIIPMWLWVDVVFIQTSQIPACNVMLSMTTIVHLSSRYCQKLIAARVIHYFPSFFRKRSQSFRWGFIWSKNEK